MVVADPTDEAAYVSALVGEGWENTGTGKGAGKEEERGARLQFMFSEPEWHEHRYFVFDEEEPVANVHVFGPGCPELVRHRIFKEWLLAVSGFTISLFDLCQSLCSRLRMRRERASNERDVILFDYKLKYTVFLSGTAKYTTLISGAASRRL